MNVIFMGTPDFAVGTLEAVIAAGYPVSLVVTQPDKPQGRGKNLKFPPVKECAILHGIEVFQPDRIKKPEHVEYLRKFNPDIIVVAAFGQILPQEILDMPKFGCINVHASLLPKYRGAAPIQWAVINGDTVSGVSIQRMDIGVDTGDIVAEQEVSLAADETGGSLFDKLAEVGAKLCVTAMRQIEAGEAVYVPQNHNLATHTSMIRKDMGLIDWKMPAVKLECLVRGLNPWPSAFTHLDQKTLKIWKSEVIHEQTAEEPGCIVKVTKDAIWVQTGEEILAISEVQLEGKKRMPCDAFLRGYPVKEGMRL